MKNLILIFSAFTSILFTACTIENESVFTVSGRKLFDAGGNEFIIMGVNNPHVWYPKKAYEALPVIATYNNNTVRIVWQTHGEVELLEKIIKECIRLEMIPMVELHDATGDSTRQRLLELAEYYTKPKVKEVLIKYEKYLLLNIANEWGNHSVTPEYWKNSYVKAIKVLRDSRYQTTLVVDAPGWGQNIEPILLYANEVTASDPLKNILYSIHMYGSWNSEDTLKLKLQEANDKQIPIIVGEFGYNYQEGDNNLGCKVNHKVILEKCNELGIGILPWSYTGNSGGNEWLDLVDADDWKTLTSWGEEVYLGETGISGKAKKALVFNK